jgi:hypothetical protein
LWDIALKELGSGERYQEIANLNRLTLPNPTILHEGNRLSMPHDAKFAQPPKSPTGQNTTQALSGTPPETASATESNQENEPQ